MEETGGRRITMVDKTTQLLLKVFGIMKAPTSEENAARWNQEARRWKQQADEHYEADAPDYGKAGIPESAARYHT